MQKHLIEPVQQRWGFSFEEAQIWSPDPAAPERSEEWLKSGIIDMFLLASGSGDGHVAFNGPHAPRDSVTSVVKLADSTRRDNLATYPMFEEIERVPQHGVTMGISTIIRVSTQAILVLPGTEKAHSLELVASSTKYDERWPATVIHDCRNSRIYASQE
jgi:glucosamine-6-phosphate deaminase